MSGSPTSGPDGLAAADTQERPGVGSILAGRYELVRKIGEGGMGAIYQGRQITIERILAIKVLTVEDAANRGFLARFLREAKAASKIRNEHVIDIIDFGTTRSGHAYYVMEFLEGEDLEEFLAREQRVHWIRARKFVDQMLTALEAAHIQGFIHRDMKPANCYRITHSKDEDFIKLIDFGIAKSTEPDVTTLTDTGVIMGTPHYMSPEQANATAVDGRTDVYAVGVILFRLVTGQYPYDAGSAIAVLTAHLTSPTPSARDVCPAANIPTALDAAIAKAMAKEPEQRWQSAAEFRDALNAIDDTVVNVPVVGLAGQGLPRRRRGPALAAAALGMGLAAGGAWFLGIGNPTTRGTDLSSEASAVDSMSKVADGPPVAPVAAPSTTPVADRAPAQPVDPKVGLATSQTAPTDALPPLEPDGEPEVQPTKPVARPRKTRSAKRQTPLIEKAIQRAYKDSKCAAEGTPRFTVSGRIDATGRFAQVKVRHSTEPASLKACIKNALEGFADAGSGASQEFDHAQLDTRNVK